MKIQPRCTAPEAQEGVMLPWEMSYSPGAARHDPDDDDSEYDDFEEDEEYDDDEDDDEDEYDDYEDAFDDDHDDEPRRGKRSDWD